MFNESTYSPPADGPCVLFCANPDVVLTNLQPRRAVGLCRGAAFAQNAKFAGKWSALAQWHTRQSQMGYLWSPRFHWAKTFKTRFRCVFKNAHDLFLVRLGCVLGVDELPASPVRRGLAQVAAFHCLTRECERDGTSESGQEKSFKNTNPGLPSKVAIFRHHLQNGVINALQPCRTWLWYMATKRSGRLFRKVFKYKTHINQVVDEVSKIVVLIAPLIAGVVWKIGLKKALKAFVSVG